MDVSYRWLKALAPTIDEAPEVLAERLAMYGAPVDDLIPVGVGLTDIVVARVEASRPHPDADRLSLCRVDAGNGTVSVVCGAPNVRDGGLYPFAPVGATLPGGEEIRDAEIRGQTSQGMLCSERELGLGRDHEGIMELHGDFAPGTPLLQALELEDVRLVVDVTANRPDLLSHTGIARELAPGGVADIALPPFPDPHPSAGQVAELSYETVTEGGETGGVGVRIADASGCPRYTATLVRGVAVGPSPAWLATRLRAAGLRPINNVVDATNYVLLETGQPLHAFDLDLLHGPEIIVRRAVKGEMLVTLDGEKRRLDESVLMIADADRSVAIAGVMGGQDSEVGADTTNVLLECALFEPRTIRATRTALGMSTDASFRFERGVDPEAMEAAARRATELILALAGGELERRAVDVYPRTLDPPVVALRPSRVERLLGAAIGPDEVIAYLEPLGFQAVEKAEDRIAFRVPGYRRYDVEREVDLIEEVARRHGYDRFPDTLGPFRPSVVPQDPVAGLEDRLRDVMVAEGFREARRVPFVPEAEGDVALLHPLSSEESRLRRDLVPGLVRAVELNFARGVRDVRLFELGSAFAPGHDNDRPAETTRLAVVFTGTRHPRHWSEEALLYDAWDLKGLARRVAVVAGLGANALEVTPDGLSSVYADDVPLELRDEAGKVVGQAGRVRDDVLDAPAWAGPVWALELTLTEAMQVAGQPAYQPLPAFPGIERDLALLVPDGLAAARVDAVAREAAGELLEGVRVFDVYRGAGVADGVRSIAYRLRFRSAERTLTDVEADEAVERVLARLQEELDVRRRT